MKMKLEKSSGLILPQYVEPSVCERCGAAFTCGASSFGCWCQEITLSAAARAVLRERYRSCLCRACLENFAESEKRDGEEEEQVSTGATY